MLGATHVYPYSQLGLHEAGMIYNWEVGKLLYNTLSVGTLISDKTVCVLYMYIYIYIMIIDNLELNHGFYTGIYRCCICYTNF